MRICSLLPSATEIAFALGLGDQVVAVSHECDYPHEASNRPVLTKSAIHQKFHRSLEVDREVGQRGGDIYEIDEKLLEKLKPDLIHSGTLSCLWGFLYEGRGSGSGLECRYEDRLARTDESGRDCRQHL